jgi:hypothetical protein
MRRLALAVGILTVTGCASMWEARIRPASAGFEASRREKVLDAALRVLESRGFAIDVADPASGIVRTKLRELPGKVPCGYLKCPYRDTVEVTVSQGAIASVRILRELGPPNLAFRVLTYAPEWSKPATTQRSTVAGVEADQAALLGAILAVE